MVSPIKFGCQIITYGDINKTIQYAILVERAGFDAVSLPDHLFHSLNERFLKDSPWDAFTLLTAIGLNTQRIKTMPGVANAFWWRGKGGRSWGGWEFSSSLISAVFGRR